MTHLLEIQYSSLTLSHAVDRAATNRFGIVDVSPHTLRWFRSSVLSLINHLGDIEIGDVSPRDVAAWQKNQVKQDVNEITANSYLRGLKTLFSRLQRNGTIGQNPAQPIRPLPEANAGPKAIVELDYLLMRETAASKRDVAILDTLWSTGCRAEELIGMNINKLEVWEDGSGVSAAIQVKGKLQKKRWVYWKYEQAESLAAWVKERPTSKSPALFLTRSRQRFTNNGFTSLIRQIRVNAGVLDKNTNPHAFRHAFAQRKLDEGHDIAYVSQWLGHSSPEFTAKVYCVRSEDMLRKRFFMDPNLPEK